MGIDDITTLLESYGIGGGLFIILAYIIIAGIKSEWFSGFLSKVSDKFIETFMKSKTKDVDVIRNITDSDITNHDVFNYIDFWTYSKIPTFQFFYRI
jgi:hypothetical protein